MTTTTKEELERHAQQVYQQALTEALARRGMVPPAPPHGAQPTTSAFAQQQPAQQYVVPGPVAPNQGINPMMPMLRSLMEQKLGDLPQNDPRRQLILNMLATADHQNALPPQAAQQLNQSNMDLLMQSVQRAKQESDARSAAALEEGRRIAAEHVELRALLNTLMTHVADNAATLQRLRDELPLLIAREVELALTEPVVEPVPSSSTSEPNQAPANGAHQE